MDQEGECAELLGVGTDNKRSSQSCARQLRPFLFAALAPDLELCSTAYFVLRDIEAENSRLGEVVAGGKGYQVGPRENAVLRRAATEGGRVVLPSSLRRSQ